MRSDRTKVVGRAAGYCASVLLAAVLATGCLPSSGGSPTPQAPDSSATTGSSGDTGGAPKITGPQLNAVRYLDNPCGLLPANQAAPFNLSGAGTAKDTTSGRSCTWENLDDPTAPRVSVEVSGNGKGGGQGLATAYQNRARIDGFAATQLDGYPAVHGNTDNVSSCETMIGVQDKVMVVVGVHVHDRHSAGFYAPCGFADQIGHAVLGTLKAGS